MPSMAGHGMKGWSCGYYRIVTWDLGNRKEEGAEDRTGPSLVTSDLAKALARHVGQAVFGRKESWLTVWPYLIKQVLAQP
jgi:hypothetical protein